MEKSELYIPVVTFEKATPENIIEFDKLLTTNFIFKEVAYLNTFITVTDSFMSGYYNWIAEYEQSFGKLSLDKWLIDEIIDYYTMKNSPKNIYNYVGKLIQVFDYSVDFLDDGIVFDNVTDHFVAKRMSDHFPIAEIDPTILSYDRHSTCHDKCVELSEKLPFDHVVATGYVSYVRDCWKFLHSWVEFDYQGTPHVFDYTQNVLVTKDTYYAYKNVGEIVSKIPQKTISKENQIINSLKNYNPLLIKLYLANHEEALSFYNDIVKPFETKTNSSFSQPIQGRN